MLDFTRMMALGISIWTDPSRGLAGEASSPGLGFKGAAFPAMGPEFWVDVKESWERKCMAASELCRLRAPIYL